MKGKEKKIKTMKFNSFIFKKRLKGFTLIELLVVIAVLVLLLAILLPSLGKAKAMAKRMTCQSNLKQIALAWNMYLDDNDGRFYQWNNANLNYGGWQGIVGWLNRPLNSYFNLPADLETKKDARIFCCPADRGGVPGWAMLEKAYDYLGTSYQTNIMLIGQNQLSLRDAIEFENLHTEINYRLRGLNRNDVDNPSRLLLIGDYGWFNQWRPQDPPPDSKEQAEWHGRENCHNMAFLDSHVEFLNIKKGFYVTDRYTVVPFKELYDLARESQIAWATDPNL